MANNTEMTIRYEAPAIETAELIEAVEKLDVLASNIENEIRYRVPVEEQQADAVEYAENGNNKKADVNSNADEFLSYNSVTEENE
jgi:hypothetical protein